MGGQSSSNASGFDSQPSQNLTAAPHQFGGFFGSSTDFNNPFGSAATKSNPFNTAVQPNLGRGQAPSASNANPSNNVPAVFNSIWSSEPADKKYESSINHYYVNKV